jgi:FtsZ-interacting cell division protein ZipA
MSQAKFSLSQETVTIVTVGVALAGIMFVGQGDMRAEARAHRANTDATIEAFRVEARADRAKMDATIEAIRTEARAHRAKMDATIEAIRAEAQAHRARIDANLDQMRTEARADRKASAQQITGLVEQQGTLSGLVEGLGRAIASSRD